MDLRIGFFSDPTAHGAARLEKREKKKDLVCDWYLLSPVPHPPPSWDKARLFVALITTTKVRKLLCFTTQETVR